MKQMQSQKHDIIIAGEMFLNGNTQVIKINIIFQPELQQQAQQQQQLRKRGILMKLF